MRGQIWEELELLCSGKKARICVFGGQEAPRNVDRLRLEQLLEEEEGAEEEARLLNPV